MAAVPEPSHVPARSAGEVEHRAAGRHFRSMADDPCARLLIVVHARRLAARVRR